MKLSRGIRLVTLFEGAKGALILLAGFGLLALVHRDLQYVADEVVRTFAARWGQHALPSTGLGNTPEPKAPHREKSAVDLQPLTAIQHSNFTPEPATSCAPITLTVSVTICPSTTSRQHCFHRTAPLYMRGAIIFRSLLRS